MNARVFYPPIPALHDQRPSVFFAGSIEMGVATDWQTALVASLGDLDINLFNPRRADWDSSWAQTKHDYQFGMQVNWELDHLARANVIALYFDPATKSPISLLELGLHASTGKIICCCSPGFWRKGNVDIVCERWGIPVWESFETFAAAVRRRLIADYL